MFCSEDETKWKTVKWINDSIQFNKANSKQEDEAAAAKLLIHLKCLMSRQSFPICPRQRHPVSFDSFAERTQGDKAMA